MKLSKRTNFIDFDAPKRAKVKKRYITFFRKYPLFLHFPKNGIPWPVNDVIIRWSLLRPGLFLIVKDPKFFTPYEK